MGRIRVGAAGFLVLMLGFLGTVSLVVAAEVAAMFTTEQEAQRTAHEISSCG
jgi:hypothetical protein